MSPGRSSVLRAACATIASHEWYMSPRLPRERSSPFTRATISRRRSPSSSGVTTIGPERGREVLALRRPEADLHLAPLQVAGRPVVHDREAADRARPRRSPPPPRARSRAPRSPRGTGSRRRARRSRPGSRSRRPGSRTTRRARPARPRDARRVLHVLLEGVEVAHRRRAAHGRAAGRTSSSGYSACSRAAPPPVKNASSVCAASWITRSPSIRPGQPRGPRCPSGVNMQASLRLRVDDDVGDARAARGGSAPRSRSRARAPRRATWTGRGRASGRRASPSIGVEEAELARAASRSPRARSARRARGRRRPRARCALPRLGQRLEVRLHRRPPRAPTRRSRARPRSPPHEPPRAGGRPGA